MDDVEQLTTAASPTDGQVYANRTTLTKLLAQAMGNPDVRKLFKEEALKRVDNDEDVLLALVKHQLLPATQQTFLEYLGDLHGSYDEVAAMLQADPLLTVLVPRLHHLNFSAEEWNVSKQVPLVALRNEDVSNTDMVAVNQRGEVTSLSSDQLPDQVTVVLKSNERLTVSEAPLGARTAGEGQLALIDGLVFRYTDPAFNPNAENQKNARVAPSAVIDPKIMRAYDLANKYWYCPQREHIYYGMDPENGVFYGYQSTKHAEAITQLRLENAAVYENIQDWTDGSLEIYVTAIFIKGSKSAPTNQAPAALPPGVADNSAVLHPLEADDEFAQLTKVIPVHRDQLLDGNTPKPYVLEYPLVFAPWDYEYHGDQWKFVCSEYDPESITTKTINVKTTRSNGFSINLGPFKVKLFGSSSTKTVEKLVTIYEGPDALGEAFLHWKSPVIKDIVTMPDGSTGVSTNQIHTGSLLISFETVRIAQ